MRLVQQEVSCFLAFFFTGGFSSSELELLDSELLLLLESDSADDNDVAGFLLVPAAVGWSPPAAVLVSSS